MSLEDQVNTGLKEAMLAKDEASLRALRALKSAILLAKTSESGSVIDQAGELKIVQRLVKQRKDSIEIYMQQGREDLSASEIEEVEVLEKFLPAQMSESEIRNAVQKAVDATGASTPSDMGKVMGMVTKELAGRADNKQVAAIVKELLSG